MAGTGIRAMDRTLEEETEVPPSAATRGPPAPSEGADVRDAMEGAEPADESTMATVEESVGGMRNTRKGRCTEGGKGV